MLLINDTGQKRKTIFNNPFSKWQESPFLSKNTLFVDQPIANQQF